MLDVGLREQAEYFISQAREFFVIFAIFIKFIFLESDYRLDWSLKGSHIANDEC